MDIATNLYEFGDFGKFMSLSLFLLSIVSY